MSSIFNNQQPLPKKKPKPRSVKEILFHLKCTGSGGPVFLLKLVGPEELLRLDFLSGFLLLPWPVSFQISLVDIKQKEKTFNKHALHFSECDGSPFLPSRQIESYLSLTPSQQYLLPENSKFDITVQDATLVRDIASLKL